MYFRMRFCIHCPGFWITFRIHGMGYLIDRNIDLKSNLIFEWSLRDLQLIIFFTPVHHMTCFYSIISHKPEIRWDFDYSVLIFSWKTCHSRLSTSQINYNLLTLKIYLSTFKFCFHRSTNGVSKNFIFWDFTLISWSIEAKAKYWIVILTLEIFVENMNFLAQFTFSLHREYLLSRTL